jgi:hypothetical protein
VELCRYSRVHILLLAPDVEHWIFIEIMVVCQGEFTYRITEINKKPMNSFDQERLEHPSEILA